MAVPSEPDETIYPPPAGGRWPVDHHQYLSVETQESKEKQYHGQVSDDEAQKELDILLAGINRVRSHLTGMLNTHGDIILNRWTKKSKNKREAILEATGAYQGILLGHQKNEDLSFESWVRDNGDFWSGARCAA